MSTSAASNLSPAFPEKAAWGTATKLRAWQAEALEKYLSSSPRDFLAVATPGAGKTTFALRIATELLARGEVDRIIVVAPTEHLKTQWADAAARVGVQINPNFSHSGAALSRDYIGVAVTYAGVASRPAIYEQVVQRHRTLVILDEIHHGGDALAWGDGLRQAFTGATRRLSLTGTPFRSDTNAIPFVTYAPDHDGIRRSVPDYSYGYADALRDGVVRPVLFLAYGGAMRWRTSAGDEIAAQLGEPATKDVINHAWRTALDPKGEWIPSVLRAADRRLTEVRRHVPDAGGLVIASNQTKARAYARVLKEITGTAPTVVLSDDGTGGAKIEKFAADTDRWMIAVRMVSEGVDVPRLTVGVYATSTSTPLYFAQAVGRFVRARCRGETASVFLPSVPVLLEHAASMEAERDHALDRPKKEGAEEVWLEDSLVEQANRTQNTEDFDAPTFEALESDARFDHVLFDAEQFGMGGSDIAEDEEDFLGLPGLLEPDQVSQLLRERQHEQLRRSTRRKADHAKAQQHEPVSAHRALAARRKELNSLVAAYARKTGLPHARVHIDLRSTCGGPSVEEATTEQVQARISKIRDWFVGRR